MSARSIKRRYIDSDYMDLSNKGLVSVAENEATDLVVKRNFLSDMEWLSNCKKVKRLDVSSNEISLFNGSRLLIELDVSSNQLSSLSGIEDCTGLKFLNVSDNQVECIDELAKINLHVLIMNGNKFSLSCILHLTRLDVSRCGLKETSWLKYLPTLKILDVSHNELEAIDEKHNLEQLVCSFNRLTRITDSDLVYLDISHNKMVILPFLPKALVVNCSSNMIKFMFVNHNLRQLQCSDNPVDTLDYIVQMPLLTRFVALNTKITDFSKIFLLCNVVDLVINFNFNQNIRYRNYYARVTGRLMANETRGGVKKRLFSQIRIQEMTVLDPRINSFINDNIDLLTDSMDELTPYSINQQDMDKLFHTKKLIN